MRLQRHHSNVRVPGVGGVETPPPPPRPMDATVGAKPEFLAGATSAGQLSRPGPVLYCTPEGAQRGFGCTEQNISY